MNTIEDDYQFQHLKNQNKIHNIFFSYKSWKNMVLDDKILDEILEYLDKSINNLLNKLSFFDDKNVLKDVNKFLLTIKDDTKTVI